MARRSRPTTARRLAWAGYFVLLAGAGTVGIHFGWQGQADFRQPTLTPEAASTSSLTSRPAPARRANRTRAAAEDRALGEIAPDAGTPEPPSFDIVRVSSDGSAVLAGRAPVGSHVTVLDGGRPLVRMAARGGEWAAVLDTPLDVGNRDLTLEAVMPDGAKLVGAAPVVVFVPGRSVAAPSTAEANSEPAPIAVRLASSAGESSVLLTPAHPADGPVALALSTVDHGEAGAVSLTGSAPEGRVIRAYLDDQPVGIARTDAKDSWRLVPSEPIRVGSYRLRIDQIAEDGVVEARIELPFVRPAAAEAAALTPERRIIVRPGTSLWRIARQTYGKGLLFTTIYRANAAKILDPDLIYPGQIFTLPRVASR